ncbi:MAG: CoA transferase [Parvularculaceae bacterium]|jgi:alpha-methylacyl-CoA racemase|nr:CoA transferase [Parvularculaceae bacterium]
MAGPLSGVRIIEFAGLGPGPFCAMMLADHGAEVIRIDRKGGGDMLQGPLLRSRKSIVIDIKAPAGASLARELVRSADGLIEGFRPGVMERLGLGPDVLLKDNPKLVYGRMTGWGQTGPLAHAAGHDINYIAVSGALSTCGRAGDKPTPPVNYLGDFGGGGMMLAFGMTAAMLAVKNGAPGQVIDCAMTDGSAALTAMTWGFYNLGVWKDAHGVNMLDTGAHFYEVYETRDGKWISVGAIEPQFYAQLRRKLGLEDDADFDAQHDRERWPSLKERLAALIRTRNRAEWDAIFEGTDACVAPVLSLREAPVHPHNAARGTFIEVGGETQPAPAPRYSATATDPPRPPAPAGAQTDEILSRIGKTRAEIDALRAAGVVA